jgi:branched-chain amino acid transport system substrate-binding protein
VLAWAAAVKAANSTDGEKVAAALHAGSFDTLIGKISFDRKGDVTAGGYVLYQWSNGGYAMIR